METQTTRDADIRQAYRELLDRAPTPQALEMWLRGPLSVAAIRDRIRATEEFAACQAARGIRATAGVDRKLLLFGAYGNGNLGDMIQAESLGRAIAAILPSIGVWATSVMHRPYPFADGRSLPSGFVRHPAAMAAFDAVLIGGGGLLAHPHDPLADADWVASLSMPVLIFGIGASDFFAPKAASLIRKAVHVSARDRESMLSLLSVRRGVSFGIDPVLGDRQLTRHDGGPRRGICWIVRGPARPVHGEIRARIEAADTVVGFEPDVDGALRGQFPELVLVSGVAELSAILSSCERVISMRYHGVILGLKAGVASYALDVPKGAALLAMLGLPHCASASPSALLAAAPIDMGRTDALIAWFVDLYELNLKSALEAALYR